MCIQTGKTMSDSQRMKFATDQFYFKTAEEMAQVFRELPDAVSRTVAIAERCNLKIERVRIRFPNSRSRRATPPIRISKRCRAKDLQSRAPQLERCAKEGLLRHPLEEYERRLTAEIEMIKKMRFAGYFLIVWDFIRYARAQGVPVGPGRGSAAGSLVSYALQHYGRRSAAIRPAVRALPQSRAHLHARYRYRLLHAAARRSDRIRRQEIRRKERGADHHLRNHGGEGGAEGCRAARMDMPYGDVDRLAKLVPAQLNITLDEALKQSAAARLAAPEG